LRHAKPFCGHWTKATVSLCLAGLVLLQLAMGACESLHKFFHADADDPGHECAVTLFAHGQVDACPVELPLVLPVTWIDTTPPPVFSLVSATLKNLPPGRAPPVPAAAS
jgi:hypothetical protein